MQNTTRLKLLLFFCLILGRGLIHGQYIEHICPECSELFEAEEYEKVKDVLISYFSKVNSKEDSLLLDLNMSTALSQLGQQEESEAIYNRILEGENEKYYKAYCLALEKRARPYMFKDKNEYLKQYLIIDSIATANIFTQGILRTKTSIGHAYYTLVRDMDAAYRYFMDVLAYDDIPKSYYLGVLNGAYDCSNKLGKGNTDSIYRLATNFIEERKSQTITTKDSSSIGSFYGIVGNNMLRKGELDSALEHNLKAADYKPKAKKFQYGLCRLFFNISRIFQILTNYEKAHEYADKIEVLATKYNYKSLFGDVAALRGNLYLKQNELEKAKTNFNAFFQYNEISKLKQNSLLVTAYADMAYLYIQQDSLGQAERFLSLGRDMISKTKEGTSHMNMHSVWCKYYINLKDYGKALIEANLLLDMSRRYQDVKFEQKAYDYISQSNFALQNYKVAYEAGEKSKIIQDSIFRAEQNYLVHNLEAKHFKKEQGLEIARLQTQDQLSQERLSSQNKTILIGSVALSLISLLSFFLYKQRQKIGVQNEVISKSLSEKELLLKEIHHRVKNNLQVVSSLLSLQSEYIKDDSALTAINEGRSRVHSMALIHQNLYSDDNLKGINMKPYLQKLIQGLFDTYNINEHHIKLRLDIEDIKLDVDSVVPLGLIANELVSNALKHAFTEEDNGVIEVQLKEQNGTLYFKIKDNGKGMDTSIIKEEMDSFGYQMITAFKDKMYADMIIDGKDGLSVTLSTKQYTKH